jgi:chromosome segregation ATPase
MIDAFKNLAAGNKREVVLSERQELEQLIQAARAERVAMDKTLLLLRQRSASLTPIARSFDQIAQVMSGTTTKLEDIGERLATLDGRTREMEQLGGRIQDLQNAAAQAEQSFREATRPDGELRKHREAIEQLSAQARGTHASLAVLKDEHAVFEALREELRSTQVEIKQSVEHAGALEQELEQLRGVAGGLTEEWVRLDDTSQKARQETAAAVAAIGEVEKKLGPLMQIQSLGHNTEERLVTLNALAERVSLKAKTIESQQLTVEHALVQSNRVQEMVWSMEQHIAKLSEGMRHAAAAEETLRRLEKLSTDTTERLEGAARLQAETGQQAALLENRGAALLESMHAQIGVLAVGKKEVEAVNERLRILDGALSRAEERAGALAAQEKDLDRIADGIEVVSKRFEALFAQSDQLAGRQLVLDGLHQQLADLDALGKKTSWQMEWLRQGREEMDALRKDILDFQESHARLAQLRADLSVNRDALEAFGVRMTAASARMPELEATVGGILTRMAHVESASQQARWLKELMSTLDGQVARLEARASLVDTLEARMNGLHTLSAEIDRRLERQLEHRTEFDRLKIASEGVAAQIADAHHKVEGLNALHDRLLPVVEHVRALEVDVESTRSRLDEIKSDGATIAELAEQYSELRERDRLLASEVAERTQQMQALSGEVVRCEQTKNVLVSELDAVQRRQRETIGQTEASEDQLVRVERLFKQLEERRAQIAVGESKLAAVEARLAELKQTSADLERSHQAIATREQLVSAIKEEVETVHLISARSRADLDYVVEHRGEVSAVKAQVDQLSSRLADTNQRMVSIDARGALLDEVETKANAIVNLLDDVRINLETIGEQKAVVDQVAQTVGQLEFRLQEARRTIGALQHERDLAERLEHGIRQLSLKAGRAEDVKANGDGMAPETDARLVRKASTLS